MKALFINYVTPVLIINFGNVSAYVFQIILTRYLNAADVGAFNALLSTVTLLAAPAAIAPLAVTRMLVLIQKTAPDGAVSAVVAKTGKFCLVAAALIFLTMILASQPLKSLLKISEFSTVYWLAILFALTFIYPVAAGWFQAQGRYIGAAMVLGGVPILRLVFGVIFLAGFGFGLDASLASAALPCAIVYCGAALVCGPGHSKRHTELTPTVTRDTISFILPAACTTTLIYALFNLDVMLVRMIWTEEDSGLYSVAAVLGRIPFLLPAALASIFFTNLKLRASGDSLAEKRILVINLISVACIAFGLAFVMTIFAEYLLVLLAGQKYIGSTSIFLFSCFAMAELAILNMIVTFGMARDNHTSLWILLFGVALFALTGTLFAPSPLWVAAFLLISIGLMTILCFFVVWFNIGKHTSRDQPSSLR